jgi:hypothetical protein
VSRCSPERERKLLGEKKGAQAYRGCRKPEEKAVEERISGERFL